MLHLYLSAPVRARATKKASRLARLMISDN